MPFDRTGIPFRSSGMPFSQELKIEAFAKGYKCAEIDIQYRARAGKEKLNTIGDGLGNITHLLRKRVVLKKRSALTGKSKAGKVLTKVG